MKVEQEVRFKESVISDYMLCEKLEFFPEVGKEMLKGFKPFFIGQDFGRYSPPWLFFFFLSSILSLTL